MSSNEKTSKIIFDTIIIGYGLAAVSAAITLKNRNKSLLIISKDIPSEKLNSNNTIKNYAGISSIKAYQLGNESCKQINSLNIKTIHNKVTTVFSMPDVFYVNTDDNKTHYSKSIIIASGINYKKPYIGEKEFIGKGVSYCATCDGVIYKNKDICIIDECKNESNEIEDIKFLSKICSKVIYLPKAKTKNKIKNISHISNIHIIKSQKISILGNEKVDKILVDNKIYFVDCVFIFRDTTMPDSIIPGISIKNNHIDVNRQMQTNIKGCFACGDITGKPYQYIKAAGEGNVAANSAINYLDRLNDSTNKNN